MMDKILNKKNLIVFLLLIFLFIPFNNLQAENIELPVSVSYREKIALGPEAESAVILVDPAAAENNFIIKEKHKKLENGVPVNYILEIGEEQILPEKEYRLHSVIKSNKVLIWSDTQFIKGSEILAENEVQVITGRLPSRLITFYNDQQKIKIRHLEELAQIIIEDKEYLLPQYKTASGVRYLNDELSVWNKGRELKVDYKGKEFTARMAGLKDLIKSDKIIKGRGQEPPWQLELNKKQLKFKFGYLQNELNISRSQISKTKKDNELIYNVESSFINFKLKILEEIHRDIMNGEIYPLKIIVMINNKEFTGGAYLKE